MPLRPTQLGKREPCAIEWQSMPDDLRENVRKYSALVLQV